MEPERFDAVVDATRRTRLASERTYLAWWRSALAAFAVSLGIGKIVPELTGGSSFAYQLVGGGYAVLGLAFVAYAHHRHRELERALLEGRFAPFGGAALVGFTAAGIVLGIATVVVVLA